MFASFLKFIYLIVYNTISGAYLANICRFHCFNKLAYVTAALVQTEIYQLVHSSAPFLMRLFYPY